MEVLMFKRVDPFMLALLTIITFGIYGLLWLINTRDQANAYGAKIPTVLYLFIPGLNIYWLWTFGEGLELVTAKRVEGFMSFLMIGFLGPIGMALVQDNLNKLSIAPSQPYQTPPPNYAPPQKTPPAYSAPQNPPPTYSAPPPPPPGGSNTPPSIPPPPKSFK
jgi:hypothetical protein